MSDAGPSRVTVEQAWLLSPPAPPPAPPDPATSTTGAGDARSVASGGFGGATPRDAATAASAPCAPLGSAAACCSARLSSASSDDAAARTLASSSCVCRPVHTRVSARVGATFLQCHSQHHEAPSARSATPQPHSALPLALLPPERSRLTTVSGHADTWARRRLRRQRQQSATHQPTKRCDAGEAFLRLSGPH